MRRFLLPITLIVVFISFLYLGNNKIGILPPLGKFFNPYQGFWKNNDNTSIFVPKNSQLNEVADVFFDSRNVPHIFAENEHDLYFVQGYITAYNRLWQMDFQTRAGFGRLSEIFGIMTLEHDRFMRKIGMPDAAEKTAELMMRDSLYRDILQAYTDGVNAYINSLNSASLPLEYKLLDISPEKWKPVNTAMLAKLMAWDLTGRNIEKYKTEAANYFSSAEMDYLYPLYSPLVEPVVETKYVSGTIRNIKQQDTLVFPRLSKAERENYFMGSNNWAVSGKKTTTGFPILCNDPHLSLTLPSVWFEIQLHTPGINVYGVSLPGSPGVIIGFNEHIAWGFTNAGSDVFDWYKISFADSAHNFYNFEGQRLPVKLRKEIIKIRGEEDFIDTVRYTHFGPVPYDSKETPYYYSFPTDCAMRWVAHDASIEGKTFIKLNKAKNYSDFESALDFFDVPAQNFIFADEHGDIAIKHNGKFPERKFKQGRYISDGSNKNSDWEKYIERKFLPSMKNPERGFVSSANQQPADSLYPFYLGDGYAIFERGKRINDLLRSSDSISVEFMKKMQLDDYNIYASMLLPMLFNKVGDTINSPDIISLLEELKKWNYHNSPDSKAAVIFEYLLDGIEDALWFDNVAKDTDTLLYPTRDVTLLTLQRNFEQYIDDVNTPEREDIEWVFSKALQLTSKRLNSDYGSDKGKWSLAETRGTVIRHISRIPGLGSGQLSTGGNYNVINAISKTHGPSWRMIVSLEDTVKAWGVFPGGESGNPGSRFYDNNIGDWVKGDYYPLNFYYSKPVGDKEIVKTIKMGAK